MLTNLNLLNFGLCFFLLRTYRADSNTVLLYICAGLTVLLNTVQIFRSTRAVYMKESMGVFFGMGFFAFVGAMAIYSDLSFVSRGSAYGADFFYPFMQASLLQGLASLVFLLVRWLIPPD